MIFAELQNNHNFGEKKYPENTSDCLHKVGTLTLIGEIDDQLMQNQCLINDFFVNSIIEDSGTQFLRYYLFSIIELSQCFSIF